MKRVATHIVTLSGFKSLLLGDNTTQLLYHNYSFLHSEGQIIYRTLTGSLGKRFRIGRSCWWNGSRSPRHGRNGSYANSLSLLSGRDVTVNLPRTDTVIPTTIILARIHIKRDGHDLASLDVEVRDTIRAKHFKCQLSRELLIDSFQHILLYFPLCSRPLTDTTAFGHHGNDFSCNFHILLLIFGAKLLNFSKRCYFFCCFFQFIFKNVYLCT